MEDTKRGKWTVSTSEYTGVVSACCYGERWEFRDGELCAEVQQCEERGHYDGGSPSDRYLPAAVLLDMLRRAGLIPAETTAAEEA